MFKPVTMMDAKSLPQQMFGRFFILLHLTRAIFAVISISCPELTTKPVENYALRSVVNISNTAVLLEWTPLTAMNTEYMIEYYQIQSNTDNITQIDGDRTIPNVNSRTSAILLELQQNSCYYAKIRNDNNIFDIIIFATSNEFSFNQVKNVVVHEYRPILDNEAVVSAQILWEALSDSIQLVAYDVMVRTAANSSLENVTGDRLFNLSPNKVHTNIVYRTDANELIYPLKNNTRYIVQVRGRLSDEMVQPTWSEPVLIDTTLDLPRSSIYVVFGMQSRLTRLTRNNDYMIIYTDSASKAPNAFDKISRTIFYFNELSTRIFKQNLNLPIVSETFFFLSTDQTVHSMTFDWISKRLYLAVEANKQHTIYYLLDVDTNRQLVHVCTTDTTILDMVVNPFTGYIHWIEQSSGNNFRLRRFNLIKNKELILNDGLMQPTLTENVVRNCLYVAVSNSSTPVQGIGDGNNCDITMIDNTDSLNSYFLSADERGIHIGETGGYRYYDYQNKLEKTHVLSPQNNLGDMIRLDAISPGTQPLPNQSCLSPVITNDTIQVVGNRMSSQLYVEWAAPTMKLSLECEKIVSSFAPLIYIVTISTNGKTVSESQYHSYINMTGLNSSLAYDIAIMARTEFTVGENALLAQMTFEPLVSEIVPSRVSMTAGSTVITPSPSSTNPPDNFSITIIIAGSAGVVLFTVLLVCCCCCCCCCCIRRRRKQAKSNTANKQKSQHFVKRSTITAMDRPEEEDTQPVYVLPGETPIYDLRNPNSFVQNDNNSLLASYEYPLVVGSPMPGKSSVLTSNGGSVNSESYDYARPLKNNHTVKLQSHMSPKTSVSSLSLTDSYESYEYPSASIGSSNRTKDRLSLACTNKVSKLLENQSMKDIPLPSMDNDGYETLTTAQSLQGLSSPPKLSSLGKSFSHDSNEDGEYVYEMLGTKLPPSNSMDLAEKGKPSTKPQSSSHHRGNPSQQVEEDIYEVCIDRSPLPLPAPEPVTITTTPSITQMPLPSIPPDNNLPLPPLPMKGDAPVDSEGYLILDSKNKGHEEDQYANPDVHRGHNNLIGTDSSQTSCSGHNSVAIDNTSSLPK